MGISHDGVDKVYVYEQVVFNLRSDTLFSSVTPRKRQARTFIAQIRFVHTTETSANHS